MSDTPRTDAESLVNDGTGIKHVPYVTSNFARILERENQQLRAELQEWATVLTKLLKFATINEVQQINKAISNPLVQAILKAPKQ